MTLRGLPLLADRVLNKDAAFPDGRFVAGHPIAGKEQSGPAAARADLYQGANWILTPSARTRAGALEQVGALCRHLSGLQHIVNVKQ